MSLVWLSAEFERCWPWLDAAIAEFPFRTHEKDHVWGMLLRGEAQLWPTFKSCCVTTIETYPTGVKVVRGWLAGGDLEEIIGTVKRLEEWAARNGCTHAMPVGRRGWAKKLPGYKDAGTLFLKEIGR